MLAGGGWSAGRLIGRSGGRPVGQLWLLRSGSWVGRPLWFVGRAANRLVGWLVDLLVDLLVDRLVDLFMGLLVDRLVG